MDITFNLWQVIQLMTIMLGFVATFYGVKNGLEKLGLKVDLKFNGVTDDINRLEIKQDKYNSVKDRMIAVEQSASSAHHRLDDMPKVIEKIEEMRDGFVDHIAFCKAHHKE